MFTADEPPTTRPRGNMNGMRCPEVGSWRTPSRAGSTSCGRRCADPWGGSRADSRAPPRGGGPRHRCARWRATPRRRRWRPSQRRPNRPRVPEVARSCGYTAFSCTSSSTERVRVLCYAFAPPMTTLTVDDPYTLETAVHRRARQRGARRRRPRPRRGRRSRVSRRRSVKERIDSRRSARRRRWRSARTRSRSTSARMMGKPVAPGPKRGRRHGAARAAHGVHRRGVARGRRAPEGRLRSAHREGAARRRDGSARVELPAAHGGQRRHAGGPRGQRGHREALAAEPALRHALRARVRRGGRAEGSRAVARLRSPDERAHRRRRARRSRRLHRLGLRRASHPGGRVEALPPRRARARRQRSRRTSRPTATSTRPSRTSSTAASTTAARAAAPSSASTCTARSTGASSRRASRSCART